VNQFAEKILEALQHMDHMETEESHYSQVIPSFAVLMHYFSLLLQHNVAVTFFI
jgi:hypothetical protein